MLLTAKQNNRFATTFDPLLRIFRRPDARRSKYRRSNTLVSARVETLEDRVVLSAANAAAAAAANASPNSQVAAAAGGETSQIDLTQPLVEITDLVVDSVSTVTNEAGEITGLVANAVISGTVLGQDFTDVPVEIPIDIGASDNPNNADCPILNLTLGPVDLDVLGLQVSLDDCEGGPVTLDITAEPGPGNLLGNLLCDVANLLNDGSSLGDVLGGLDDTELTTVLDTVTEVVNGALGELLTNGDVTTGDMGGGGNGNGNGNGNSGRGRTCDVLNLELGATNLDVLGLDVQTSDICLDVTAERGGGNLLGNLVCNVTHLLDRGSALDGLFRNLENRLGSILDQI